MNTIKATLTLTITTFLTLLNQTSMFKCPEYYNTYINPNITNFQEEGQEYPSTATHCPDFKEPEESLCCASSTYLLLSNNFSSKYFKAIENQKLMQAYADQLSNSLSGISELLLDSDGNNVTISVVRSVKSSMESFVSTFKSSEHDQRCLHTLFAHEASILCLACNGEMTKKYLSVQRSLFRGQMYLPTSVLNSVAQNCQKMFQKVYRFVSLLIMGLYTFDDKEEINISMTSENSKFLEWLIVLHQTLYQCMAQENCVDYIRNVITPYGSNLDWLLLGNKGAIDVGEFIGRLFEKSYSKDLRLLERESTVTENNKEKKNDLEILEKNGKYISGQKKSESTGENTSAQKSNLKKTSFKSTAKKQNKIIETLLAKLPLIISGEAHIQPLDINILKSKRQNQQIFFSYLNSKTKTKTHRVLQDDSSLTTEEKDALTELTASQDEDRQAVGLFDLQTVFSDSNSLKLDTLSLGFKQLMNIGFNIQDLRTHGMNLAAWMVVFVGIMGIYMNVFAD